MPPAKASSIEGTGVKEKCSERLGGIAKMKETLHHVQRMFDAAALHVGYVSGRLALLEFGPLLRACVAGVCKDDPVLIMQQLRGDRHVGHFDGRAPQIVRQTGVRIRSDVRLHPEVPMLAFLGRCMPGARAFVRFFRRGGCVDDGRVHQSALGEQQTAVAQLPVRWSRRAWP
jgi:hypothetical protein